MSFAKLRELLAREQPVFSPFFMLGDPTPELSVEIAARAAAAGASALELGIPFSDPVADGPEVALAGKRALTGGTGTAVAFDCLRRIRERVDIPLNLLVYANLVHARGWRAFARDAASAGASSLLCPDVVIEESEPLASACAEAELGLVHLVGPSTSSERVAEIGAHATAFLYLVSHQGITGSRTELDPAVDALVRRTAEAGKLPVCLGFGLSRPAHLAAAFRAGARIAIVGSALVAHVRRFTESGSHRGSAELLALLEEDCRSFAAVAATTPFPC